MSEPPVKRQLTDEFLRVIARSYNAAVVEGAYPAPAIAGQFDAPVGTVHRWVREARRRGLMPRGRQGTTDGWNGKCCLTAAMKRAIETALETGDLSDLRDEYGRAGRRSS